jgi:hypothetical protein
LSIAAVTVGFAISAVLGSLSGHDHHRSSSHDACIAARSYLNQSSRFSNAYSYGKAYDTAMRGLKANQDCKDMRVNLVNAGFLLSTKAIAEHFLKKGDSASDLKRAMDLLERCREMAPTLGRVLSNLCEKLEQNDIVTRARFDMHQTVLQPPRWPW